MVNASEPMLEVAPITNPIANCLLADGVDTILGQDPYVFSSLIEEALEPELSVIPNSIESNLDGVLNSLNIDDQVDLLGTDMSIQMMPNVIRVDESGILLGFGASVGTDTISACIDPLSFTPPEDQQWPEFTGNMFQTGMRFDAGIFVGKHFVDQILHAVWASEALCLNVSDLADLNFTGEFAAGFLGDELGELMGTEPVDLQLLVDSPFDVVFSDDQPPITIALSDTHLQTFGEVLDRSIMLQSVSMEADLGVYIEIENQRLTLDLPLDSNEFFFGETYHEVLPVGYSTGVPNLIDLALGSLLTDDLFPTVLLPTILGMEIDRLIWQPTADGTWLGGHVILDVDQIQPVEITGCSSDNIGCDGSGPTIDIDIENILGCDSTEVGCEGGCSQGPNGHTIRLPAGRVFGFLLIMSAVCIRRREG